MPEKWIAIANFAGLSAMVYFIGEYKWGKAIFYNLKILFSAKKRTRF
jgi:hypothetical protein